MRKIRSVLASAVVLAATAAAPARAGRLRQKPAARQAAAANLSAAASGIPTSSAAGIPAAATAARLSATAKLSPAAERSAAAGLSAAARQSAATAAAGLSPATARRPAAAAARGRWRGSRSPDAGWSARTSACRPATNCTTARCTRPRRSAFRVASSSPPRASSDWVQGKQAPYFLFDVLGGPEILPGAIPAQWMAQPGSFNDPMQQQFAQTMARGTQGRNDTVLVFYCLSNHCWMSYNAALPRHQRRLQECALVPRWHRSVEGRGPADAAGATAAARLWAAAATGGL